MKTIRMIILAVGMVSSLHLLHAQTAIAGSFNGNIASVQSAQEDSIVSVAADAQGLQLVPPDQVPPYGTFWWVMPGGSAAPLPCPPQVSSAAIYQIAEGQFLVDETGGQVAVNTRRFGLQATSSTAASALATQTDALVNLITQIQTATANQQARAMARAMGMDVPSPGGDGSGDGSLPMFSSTYTIDTNGLWLEIVGISNGAAWFNLHNSTNQVYAITSKSNLLSAGWDIEREVWPDTNQTVTPFTVPVLDRPSLFIWAQDWTGVTENGNTTPDWWFWEYFQTLSLSDTNLDSQGNTLLYDYQNGLDPNIINFLVSVTNDYINNMTAQVQLNILGGVPSYVAVAVDDTNYAADANWQAYTGTNLAVSLGLNEGWHSVWIGLKGLPPDATQTWQWLRLNLAWSPVLVITNPVSNIVSVRVIQIYGYCQDTLASLCYDLSNATGLAINQPAEVTGRDYDTNSNILIRA